MMRWLLQYKKICNYTGWIYGEAWMPNQDGTRLERNHAFYGSIDGLEKFSEYSCGLTFTPGSGLPGRAWAEKQPLWIKDVTQDPHYLRAAIAGEVGLKTGIGFPVIADGEVVSVFVFYSLKVEEINDNLIKLILSMLSQIGLIIKRIQAEDALHESEERLRSILDNTTAVVYIKDIQGRYTFINRQFETLFHVKRGEIKGKSPYDCFPEEIAAAHLENDRKVFEVKIPMQFDEMATHDDGQLHSYLSVKFPLFDSAGTVYAVCGISTDITERKRMEDQLRRLSSAVEQSSTTIVITDTNGNIQYVNPKFTQLTGYTPEEAIGKNPRILKSGKTPPEVYKQLWDAITAGGEWQGEFCNKKRTENSIGNLPTSHH